jgi:hypothetical protein
MSRMCLYFCPFYILTSSCFSGTVLLCIPPIHDSEALHSVKWHPKEPDTLAVASENEVYLIDLANTHALRGQTLAHTDIHHIGQIFPVSSVRSTPYCINMSAYTTVVAYRCFRFRHTELCSCHHLRGFYADYLERGR